VVSREIGEYTAVQSLDGRGRVISPEGRARCAVSNQRSGSPRVSVCSYRGRPVRRRSIPLPIRRRQSILAAAEAARLRLGGGRNSCSNTSAVAAASLPARQHRQVNCLDLGSYCSRRSTSLGRCARGLTAFCGDKYTTVLSLLRGKRRPNTGEAVYRRV